LFVEHSRLSVVVEALLQHKAGDHRPRVMAKVDITTMNVREMPSADQVRQFNKDVRRFFREIEKRFGVSRKDYGFLWCCEFGSGNTNLHAHGVYVGPFLPQKESDLERFGYKSLRKTRERRRGAQSRASGCPFEAPADRWGKLTRTERIGAGHESETALSPHLLSDLWAEIRGDGSCIVSIKPAKNFEAALGHALKYPSKFFEADPARLVELEVAFDRVRRVHALAAFYNPKIEREPGEEGPCDAGRCPICGDVLMCSQGWHFIEDLRREGRRDADAVRIEVGRAKVLTGAGPP